jgi:hypothetical protein
MLFYGITSCMCIPGTHMVLSVYLSWIIFQRSIFKHFIRREMSLQQDCEYHTYKKNILQYFHQKELFLVCTT